MSRLYERLAVLAAVLSLSTCVNASGQTTHGAVWPDDIGIMQRGSRNCGAPPDRMAPMMTAMFGKPVTLATTPLPVLNSELKLDAGQKKRIDAIQGKLDKDVAAMSKGARSSDGLAMFSKMNDILAQADKDIDTELSAEQKAAAEMLLKNLTLLRESGLPPELYLELKLTGDQTKALTDALPDIKLENKERSRAMMAAGQSGDFKKVQSLMSKLGEKVSPILTKEQRSLVESYRKKHPQMAPTGISLGL